MAARLAIVLLAVAAIVLLGSRLREHGRCDSARADVGRRAGELAASCGDPDVIASASAVLLAAGKRNEAVRLARESVRREPDSFAGWVAVGLTLRDRDPVRSRAALARAKALNPRWQGLR